jgi:ISRin1, transposase orfA
MIPEQAEKLSDAQFKRYFGIQRSTYTHMLTILQEAYNEQHKKGGRKNEISLENKLMLTLSYYREYRTQFHLGQDFGISESAVCKTIKWVESILIAHKDFALPSKKALWQDPNLETVLIDATEVPCERPKKSNAGNTQVKRNTTP